MRWSIQFPLQRGEHLRGGVAEVDHPWLVQARQDLLDDPGRQPGVEQPPDLQDAIDEALVIVAVAVRAATRDDESLLLVVTQQPAACVGRRDSSPMRILLHLTPSRLDRHICVRV
jgi:hypothetical protein